MDSFTMHSGLLLILILSFSSSFVHVTFACGVCPTPTTPEPAPKQGPITLPPVIGNPPITLPPIIGKPPITIPPVIGKTPITLPPIIGKPPITLPPVIGKPPITLPPIIGKPPITLPPVIGKPPITLPPIIGKPPITIPPIIVNPPTTNPPAARTPGCSPSPATKKTCPVNTLKFGACLDLLGNVIQIGDPAINECCPLIKGLTGIEAAACLCTTIKLKFFNINVFYPIAVDLLISCGKTPPLGYTCS